MRTKYLSRPFEIKSVDDDGVFTGYGSVFHIEDSYREVVAPGAFAKSLAGWRIKEALPPVLWQHNSAQPVGPYLEMSEDDRGLYVKGKLLKDDVSLAREAYALMKNRVVTGLSIGYRTVVEEHDSDTRITTLKELDLWEVSIVTFPANDAARIENVKSIKDVVGLERFLRDVGGLSISEAKRVIHDIKSSVRQARDIEELIKLAQKNISTLED